jgi:hypothetical protein
MKRRFCSLRMLLLSICLLMAALSIPAAVFADGIAIPSNPEMWSQIAEGQQIAVVKILGDDKARVDLFISMLDQSGESNEVTFFLPLGLEVMNFSVTETTSLEFDEEMTDELDSVLEREVQRPAQYRSSVQLSLLSGTLVINGGWSWPIWYAVLLSGCGAIGAPQPVGTFETESSTIDIYDMEQDVDLDVFIQATGLDPSVREGLERVRGQHVAIIHLRTQAISSDMDSQSPSYIHPGIHMRWRVATETIIGENSYAYPLGTGSAWAHPIELTRVYVVAPPGIDFEVDYPELGQDLSGYEGRAFFNQWPKILNAEGPAFAVENAVGEFGRIWRVTYHMSNASEDILVSPLSGISTETQSTLESLKFQELASTVSWPISIIASILIWVFAWRFIMSRFLGLEVEWRSIRFWGEALGWAFLYPATNIAAVGVLLLLLIITGPIAIFGILIPAVTIFGTLSIFLFSNVRAPKLGVPKGRAALAYILVVLLANAVYLPIAVGYAALLHAL